MKKTLLIVVALVSLGLFAAPKAEAFVGVTIGIPVPGFYVNDRGPYYGGYSYYGRPYGYYGGYRNYGYYGRRNGYYGRGYYGHGYGYRHGYYRRGYSRHH